MPPIRAGSPRHSPSPARRRVARSPSPPRNGKRNRAMSPARRPHQRRSRSRSPIRRKRASISLSPRPRSPVHPRVHRSPRRAKSPRTTRSPPPRSLSPPLKRQKSDNKLRESERSKDIRELERSKERERERDNEKGRNRDRERGLDREITKEARGRDRGNLDRDASKDSRGKDKYGNSSSKLRYSASASPKDKKDRRGAGSPPSSQKNNEQLSERHRNHSEGRAEMPRQNSQNRPGAENPEDDSIARMKAAEEALEAKQKEKLKPSFELSGKLAAETNKVRGIPLLFNEPPDAQKPKIRWRLYVFKAGEPLNEPLYIHRQSCYLFGRERRVADIPTDHPSCSKQHAVIQYRKVQDSNEVRPYLMDLGSTNGTFINHTRLEPQRYYELMEKDTVRFGNSSREYVILHENSVG